MNGIEEVMDRVSKAKALITQAYDLLDQGRELCRDYRKNYRGLEWIGLDIVVERMELNTVTSRLDRMMTELNRMNK